VHLAGVDAALEHHLRHHARVGLAAHHRVERQLFSAGRVAVLAHVAVEARHREGLEVDAQLAEEIKGKDVGLRRVQRARGDAHAVHGRARQRG